MGSLTMSNTIRNFLIFLLAVTLVFSPACEGPVGPRGERGAADILAYVKAGILNENIMRFVENENGERVYHFHIDLLPKWESDVRIESVRIKPNNTKSWYELAIGFDCFVYPSFVAIPYQEEILNWDYQIILIRLPS